jgi:hypothetical protein
LILIFFGRKSHDKIYKHCKTVYRSYPYHYILLYACDIFTPRVQFQETMYSSWEFHVDDRSESSSTYDMIIGDGRDLLGELGIIMNSNAHTVFWDTDTIPMKDSDTTLYHR